MKRLATIRILNEKDGCFAVCWSEGRIQKRQDFKTFDDAEALARSLYIVAGGAGSAEAFDHTPYPPGKIVRLFEDEARAV